MPLSSRFPSSSSFSIFFLLSSVFFPVMVAARPCPGGEPSPTRERRCDGARAPRGEATRRCLRESVVAAWWFWRGGGEAAAPK